MSPEIPEIEQYRRRIDERCLELTGRIPSGTLREPIASLIASGKRIRPLVTLLCCEATGGEAGDALNAAVGVELLHTASLIHDDMMDQASLRRGRPTLHSVYASSIALLCGDYLVALAYEELFSTPSHCREALLELMNRTYKALCEGQALEEFLNANFQWTTERLLEVIEKKTAFLTEFAAHVGGLVACAREKHCASLARYGKMLGFAFQIQDDILDVMGNERETGKDHLLDSKNNKMTLVHSLGQEGELGDGIALARRQSEYYTDRAIEALHSLPPSEALDRLIQFTLGLVNRKV